MFLLSFFALFAVVAASPTVPIPSTLIYDGRAPLNLTAANLDTSTGPYLTGVKGATQNASHYTTILGLSTPPTPLWNKYLVLPTEKSLQVTIDNSSVFVPGGGAPQYGFRRTELLAQINNSHTAAVAAMENGTTVFHFSIKLDPKNQLNYTHEYQIVFIEPNDGSHVFGIQLGSPFTNPTGPLPVANAHSFKVLDHALDVLFSTPFTSSTWHNFAIQVDWINRTLGVFYSQNTSSLKAVTKVVPNLTAASIPGGQGDFHFGIIKLPLVNLKDSATDQGDVVHHGIQEGTKEGLIYSGVFVESIAGGVSAGHGLKIKPIL